MKQPATAKGSAKHTATTKKAAAKSAKSSSKHATAAKKSPTAAKTAPKPTATKHAPVAVKPAPKVVAPTPVIGKASVHPAPKKPTAKPAKPKTSGKVVTLSPFELVACCATTALADHLRLSGGLCTDDQMLELYFALTDDPDAGLAMDDVLEYASVHGIAGSYPEYCLTTTIPDCLQLVTVSMPEGDHAMIRRDEWLTWGRWHPQYDFNCSVDQAWEITWH